MRREKIYNYFYIINNLKNGHFYLGVHSTDKLADGYMGSGDLIKRAIKSYGKENFELTPLKFFKTRKELMDFEREIVNERFLEHYNGICYNLKKGGEGGREKKFTDEERKERESEHNRKAHRKRYQQHPEVKERCKEYQKTEKYKEYRRIHDKERNIKKHI